MKTKILLVVVGLAVGGWITWQCVAQPQFITPEQAKAAVRAFEGNPNLELGDVFFDQEVSGAEWSHRYSYDISHASYPDPDQTWCVDAVSGEVRSASHWDAYPPEDQESEDPFGSISKEQARQIALDFARAKYSGFDQMGFQLEVEEWKGRGWRFQWAQFIACGARTDNVVQVKVNPLDGRIQYYLCSRFPTPPAREPQLTSQQAIDRAKEATGIVSLFWNDEPLLSASPDGIYWTLALGGDNAEGEAVDYLVEMNGETGEIIGIYAATSGPAASGPALRSMPPRPKKGKASAEDRKFAPIRVIARQFPGATVEAIGSGRARIRVGTHTCTVRVASATALCDGRKIPLGQKVKLVGGKTMVPKVLADILAWEWRASASKAQAPSKAAPQRTTRQHKQRTR